MKISSISKKEASASLTVHGTEYNRPKSSGINMKGNSGFI